MIKRSILALAVILLLLVPIYALEVENSASRTSKNDKTSSSITGEIQVRIIDDFENIEKSRVEYYVSNQEKTYKINSRTPLNFESGDKVSVSGVIRGDSIISSRVSRETGRMVSPIRKAQNPNIGEQRLLVILANFQDDIVRPADPANVAPLFFSEQDSLNTWVKEVSFNQASVKGDVIGWYVLPLKKADCHIDAIPFAINATDHIVNYTNYDRLIVIFGSSTGPCSGGSTVGKRTLNTQDGTISISDSDLRKWGYINNGAVHHELGHQFGNRHSFDIECGNFATGLLGNGCSFKEMNYPFSPYTDFFSIMGSYTNRGHMNLIHKEKTGWISPDNIKTITNKTVGIYKIAPIEKIQNEYPKGIKINVSANKNYYIEYKRLTGYDSNYIQLNNNIFDGAILSFNIKEQTGVVDSLVIDNSPNTNFNFFSQEADSKDIVLRVNSTFIDSQTNVKITPLEANEDYLEVCIGLDNLEQCNLLKNL